MEQVMRQMGVSQQDIDATEVIIRCPDKEIVFSSPEVAKVNMMGQDSFQISGKYEERALSSVPEISKDDIKTVAEQANCSEEEAKAAI
ncbi:MAG: nascent polypeptide-associated complex protein, partial [Candidatus Woesearchaeota archaeon]